MTARKRRRRRITESQRGQVFELLERGRSQAEAARDVKISEATVSRLVHEKWGTRTRPQPEATPEPPRRSGPPDTAYADVNVTTPGPDPDPGESGMFKGFETDHMSAIAAELGPENADGIAVGPVAEPPDDVLPPLSGAPDTHYKTTGKRIVVQPEHVNQFPPKLVGRRGANIRHRDPVKDPAPFKSLFFANGP